MQELIGKAGWKVSRLDTFALPLTLANYKLKSGEKLVMTVRAAKWDARGKIISVGDILFQKQITEGVTTEDGNGTYFSIVATKAEALSIPAGVHAYDLALISSTSELALIYPSVFEVVEVLR